MIRLPVRKARLLGKISETIRRFNSMEGRDPDVDEIASILGVEKEMVEMLMPMRESVISLDAQWTEDGGRLMDVIPEDRPAPSARLCNEEMVNAVHGALAYLTDREKKVMELRYGLNGRRSMSLRKASKIVGLSQEGVRRIERRALDKLRRPVISSQLESLLIA